jgi:hypothetical protein
VLVWGIGRDFVIVPVKNITAERQLSLDLGQKTKNPAAVARGGVEGGRPNRGTVAGRKAEIIS